jgi:hypothetical protein
MAISGGDGSIILTTQIDQTGLKRGMASMKSGVAGLSKSFAKIGAAIGVAFGVGALINFGKQAVQLASDLQEVQNVVDVAFGDMAYRMEEFAKTSMETFGISKLTAKQTGSSFMAMAKGMQFADDVAADMALTLTGLSADMASFYNVRQEEARTALSAVYTGETETLKQYGILITEVNLQEFARQQGITKSINAMTQQEKVMLRYQYILQATQLAQGDFVRTQGSWANQTRILSERWKEMATIFGEAFMAIGLLVLPVINSIIVGLTKVAEAARVVAQWIYKAFTGKELKTTQSQGTALSDVGVGANEAADGMEALGDATGKANKEAKKALAGFDDLQILTSNIADSAGSAGSAGDALGGVGGVSALPEFTETQGTPPVDTTSFDNLRQILSDIKDIFMTGFWQGFQNADFSGIEQSISGIKESLTGIFTSPEVQTSAQGFVSSVVLAFGKITGSIASIGTTIATNLLGGFNLYLDGNSETIKTRIANIFDASSGIATSVGNMWTAFANIFSVFASTNGRILTSNIIGIFANAGLGIAGLGHKIGADFINFLTQPIIENQEGLKGVLDSLLGVFAGTTGGIKTLVDTLVQGVLTLYEEHISPFIQMLTDTVSEWVAKFVEAYNVYIRPVLEQFAQKFQEVVEQHLAPMFEKIFEFIGKVIDLIMPLWDGILKPLVSWLIDVFANTFSEVFGRIGDIVLNVVQFISGLISGIMDILGGIIDFIVGVFSGDWERAWNGLVGIFKGIINVIITVFEGMINLIINAVNLFISALDVVVSGVGNLVGQEWNIPKIPTVSIPRLAQGAVIPPNREFLAVLGDQKHGTNIEAPLQTIVDAFNIALAQNGGAGGGNTEVVLEIDGREFGRAVVEQGNRENRRIGTRLVIA